MASRPQPAPSTVSVLLTDALVSAGIIGVDEAMEQPILNKALRTANRMIEQWQLERFMVWQLVDYGFTSTGANTYSVGRGMNFDINPRPDRLEFAYLRQLNSSGGTPSDWDLDIIDAYEDYAAIQLKTIGTFSSALFYDPGTPVGTLYPWPVPQASIYQLHILVKQTLQRFVNLQDSITFPTGYEAALEWCLARRFRAAFQMPADPTINELAAQGKATIRKGNTQVATLRMPRELRGVGGGSAYNYRSDTP